ncbi:hypothetical protein KI387_020615 [Taxus chinensis]|uniref:H(+)-exporting diphosphatase n=1 Tax=Taxus chinensis TaxID=29808 RepID=A0AA38LCD1_TAXCH|nr:hypothetical protein KI387_020615 [Taxus chinensis]
MAGPLLSEMLTEILVPIAAVIGIAFALLQWVFVSRVKVTPSTASNGYNDHLLDEAEEDGIDGRRAVIKCAEIQNAISEGATSFLFTEYKYLGVFTVCFGAIIFLFLGSVENFSTKSQPCTYAKEKMCKPALANAIFSAIAFLLGALTSVLSGFLGMKIATYANARTTLEARKGVGKAFITAFRSGAVMGFLLAANGLLVLYISINVFKIYYGDDWEGLFEAITGYGLGGSAMALFGRVGGGIYTKAADVGADLVGKIEQNIPEDDPRNPAICLGPMLNLLVLLLLWHPFHPFGNSHDFTSMCYPLLISSMGIVICLITTLFATDFFEIKAVKEIEPALKRQLIISTVLMTIGIAIVSFVALPSTFTIFNFGSAKVVKNWHLFFCVSIGLWAGLVIGYTTEYYTSNAYSPVQEVAESCKTGAATNVIFGLALGYKSVIIPIFAIAVAIFVSFSLAAMYGIAVAALGMLSTIATGLAIDAYGPISDNAGGIAEMAGMDHKIRERTDALDAAGNHYCCNWQDASLKEMIPPGALVMLTPLIVGILFGVETLSGVLAGALVSGVQVAISASNTGGAWDNAKKYIEAGASAGRKGIRSEGI